MNARTEQADAKMTAQAAIRTSVDPASVPEKKRTAHGLYLTAADAATAIEADPRILFLDVRDPIEVALIGHPTCIDAIVPLVLATHEFDETTGGIKIEPNPHFLADVEAVVRREGLTKDSPIVVMCRSGGRSAMAANALAKSGYRQVWNLIEGFEGDKSDAGVRSINGWRNAGLPWAYGVEPTQAWTRKDR
jgi:rhodanese-related sulfurtransferase